MNIHKVDGEQEIPAWTSREDIVAFFHYSMKPYEDTLEDIQHSLGYAFSNHGSHGGFILLGEIDRRLVAGLLILHTGMKGYVPKNLLLFVSVDPEMRGQGLGGQMIERAVQECNGDIKLHVEYDNPAKRLYERLGFESKYAEMRFTNESRDH